MHAANSCESSAVLSGTKDDALHNSRLTGKGRGQFMEVSSKTIRKLSLVKEVKTCVVKRTKHCGATSVLIRKKTYRQSPEF
jgi:hypothetical protein